MTQQILIYVTQHPGLRIRYIAGALHTSNFVVSRALYELKAQGKVRSEYIRKPENLEFYDIWFRNK